MAATSTMTHQDTLNAQYLSNSFANLSSSRSANSLIVRTYKQATQQYLTKQFKEALETLEPIISAQAHGDDINGFANGDGAAVNGHGSAPIAQSTRGTRTKVWVFYLSLLHAIIEIGQEEGKLVFGSAAWRQLAAKARDGSIWDEVVRNGYGGNEGEVDADVVVNLATLLLGHMQDQRLNQQRLETYLAAADGSGSNGPLSFSQDGMSTPMSSTSSSPKSLASRLRILELYTLHVLPANAEWEYARQFIEMNDMLDEERKEQFLHALESLKEEKEGSAQREKELKEQRERDMEEQRQEAARREEEARRLEEEKTATEAAERQRAIQTAKSSLNGSAPSSKPTPVPRPSSSSSSPTTSSARPSKASKKAPVRPSPPPTFYRRASSMFGNLQQVVLQASRNLTTGQSSMALLRLIMFMAAFLLIIARRDLRIKVRRAMENGWVKVKQTVGMGVKVSYV